MRKLNHQGGSRCYLQIAGIWQRLEPDWSNRNQSRLHHLRPFFETPEHKAVSVFLAFKADRKKQSQHVPHVHFKNQVLLLFKRFWGLLLQFMLPDTQSGCCVKQRRVNSRYLEAAPIRIYMENEFSWLCKVWAFEKFTLKLQLSQAMFGSL